MLAMATSRKDDFLPRDVDRLVPRGCGYAGARIERVTHSPHSSSDPVLEVYKADLDRTLLRQNLRRTPEERLRNLIALQRLAEEARKAGRRANKPR